MKDGKLVKEIYLSVIITKEDYEEFFIPQPEKSGVEMVLIKSVKREVSDDPS